jgi:hypothetical protein
MLNSIPSLSLLRRHAMLFDLSSFRASLPANIRVFASGASRLAEIRGFARLGIPVGVCAPRLNEEAIAELIAWKRPVMVDSGAFSEVAFTAKGLHLVSLITHEEWERRLAVYIRLASALRNNAMLVVPDRVGDQQETLRRLKRYRKELAVLANAGARLLLPVQAGAISQAEFYAAACRIAGVPLIPALPMRKAATPAGELLAFVRQVRPTLLHLLGIGIDSPRAAKVIRAIFHFSPETAISMDSNRLRAVTGRNRALTLREAELRSAPIEDPYGAVGSPVLDLTGTGLDGTDVIASPNSWAGPESLRTVAERAGLSSDETAAFLRDPDGFLQTPLLGTEDIPWYEHPTLAQELDLVWAGYVTHAIRSTVRTAAIASVFADSRLCGQTT